MGRMYCNTLKTNNIFYLTKFLLSDSKQKVPLSQSMGVKASMSKFNEYFADHYQIEVIKEEFENETKDLQHIMENKNNKKDIEIQDNYKNLGRITTRMDELDKNHQIFIDVYNKTKREIISSNARQRNSDESKDNLQFLDDRYKEISGEFGTYRKAKQCGLQLINLYQTQITNGYQGVFNALVGH